MLEGQKNARGQWVGHHWSNRFKSITNEIDKQWIDMKRDAFKT
jgi:hypothetical protein